MFHLLGLDIDSYSGGINVYAGEMWKSISNYTTARKRNYFTSCKILLVELPSREQNTFQILKLFSQTRILIIL